MEDDERHHRSLKRVRTIADYQFGKGAGRALFPDDVHFTYSVTGRERQISLSTRFTSDSVENRLGTLRARDGLLTLSINGAERLRSIMPPMYHRVVVSEDAVPFVVDGKNVFSKFVLECYGGVRAGDEVLVVNDNDTLLGVGSASLCAKEIMDAKRGVAVNVRHGNKKALERLNEGVNI